MADRRSELESAIDADPEDTSNYEVLGDFLVQQNDPRGELIAQQIKAERERGYAIVEDLLTRLAPRVSPRTSLYWRAGYIYRAVVAFDELATVLDHPSARFLVKLAIKDAAESRLPKTPPTGPLLDHLMSRKRPALRELELLTGTFARYALGDLARLWETAPDLEALTLRGTASSTSPIQLPHLQRLEIACPHLPADLLARVREARWPELQRLALRGALHPDASREIDGLFASPLLPQLDELELSHMPSGLDAMVLLLLHSPLVRRLRALHLGSVTDVVADLILENEKKLSHLEQIVLRGRRLTDPMRARLRDSRLPLHAPQTDELETL